MKLKFLSLPIIAAAVSCVSAGRKPALSPEVKSVCDLVFARAFQILNESDPFNTSEMQIEYLLKSYPIESQERLLRAGSRCERKRAATALTTDAKLRLKLVSQITQSIGSGKIFSGELDGPLFTDPAMPDKLGCYAECQTSKRNNCAAECGVGKDIAEGPHQFFRFDQLMGGCRDYQKDDQYIFHREDFVKNLKVYLPEYREAFTRLKKQAASYVDSMVLTERTLKALLKHAQSTAAQVKSESCPLEKLSFRGALEQSVFRMTVQNSDGETKGTGFWIAVNGQIRIATAYHNYDRQLGPMDGDRKFELSVGDDGPTVDSTLSAAGSRSDVMHDFWQSPIVPPGPPLEVVAHGRIPQIGQKFFAAGFPGFMAGAMAVTPCVLRGFTARPDRNSSGVSMQLRCDQAADQLEGMSGGPLLDEYGTVWGVITNRADLSGLVFASSLSRDSSGEIFAGKLPLKGANLCIDPKDWSSRKRCT